MSNYQPKVGDVRKRIDSDDKYVCVDDGHDSNIAVQSPISWWIPTSVKDKLENSNADLYYWQAFSNQGWEEVENRCE